MYTVQIIFKLICSRSWPWKSRPVLSRWKICLSVFERANFINNTHSVGRKPLVKFVFTKEQSISALLYFFLPPWLGCLRTNYTKKIHLIAFKHFPLLKTRAVIKRCFTKMKFLWFFFILMSFQTCRPLFLLVFKIRFFFFFCVITTSRKFN